MLILFDQATPYPLRLFLKEHTVKTAYQQGWSRLRNGDLLRVAEEAGFDVLLTTDKNLPYQQNLTNRKIAIIVLSKQQWPDVLPHAQLVVDAMNGATSGSYTEVQFPSP